MKITSLSNIPEQTVTVNPNIKKKVMLKPGELPSLTNFSQACFSPGQIAPAHSHPQMWEVFFVEKGTGIIRINGQEYPFLVGTCVTVEPGETHEIENTSSEELIITYFGLLPE